MPPGNLTLLKSLKYNALTIPLKIYCKAIGNKMQKYQNIIPRFTENNVLKFPSVVGK